jgi:heptosyltransferase I
MKGGRFAADAQPNYGRRHGRFMTQLLIIKPSSLGDIVHGLQVAVSLKAQVPDLRISWIVRDIFAPIVRGCADIDQVFVFERQGGVAGYFRLMRQVRQARFDLAFDFQGLLRTGLMAWRTLAARKVGRTDAREGAGLFYDERVPLPPGGRDAHALEILLQFCPVLGAKPELRGAPRFREPEGLQLGIGESVSAPPPIVMFPDSRRAEKRWAGFKRFTEMLLRDDRRRRVVWAGNHYIPDKESFPKEQFTNLTGRTSLLSLPALVSRASWVISNDSGPMHLAAALGVRTLGIFGPTDPRRFGPYPLQAPTNHVIQAPVGSLGLLSAKEVFARFQRLDGPPPSGPGG